MNLSARSASRRVSIAALTCLALACTVPRTGTPRRAHLAFPSQRLRLDSECAPFSDASRTLFGIAVDTGTVDQFEAKLGKSPAHVQGDASTFSSRQCWQAANGDGTVLVIEHGELDAHIEILGREMEVREGPGCPKSPLVSRAMATANGLRLGLSLEEIERVVGPPTEQGADWFARTCSAKEPMTSAEKERMLTTNPDAAWDVYWDIQVVESNGTAEGIRITYVIQY